MEYFCGKQTKFSLFLTIFKIFKKMLKKLAYLRQNRIKTRFLTNKWKLIYFHDKSQKFQFFLKISTFFQKKLKTSIFLKIHLIITQRVFIGYKRLYPRFSAFYWKFSEYLKMKLSNFILSVSQKHLLEKICCGAK